MGKALQAANPRLVSTLLQCARREDIPLSNQKAAIQALRLMDVTGEVQSSCLLHMCNSTSCKKCIYDIFVYLPDAIG